MTDVFEVWPVTMEPLDTLIPHPENYREHDVGAIIASIDRWGVWRALVVQTSTRHVLVGNGELKALQAIESTSPTPILAPVRWLDVDDDNARAILLADNWIPSRGRNMPAELLALMKELAEERELFASTGADEDDIDAVLHALEDEIDIEGLDPIKKKKPPKPRKVACPECGHQFEMKR